MAEKEKELADIWKAFLQRKKKPLAAGTVFFLLLFVGFAILLHRQEPANVPAAGQASMGMVDCKKAMEAHPDYAKLKELEQERQVLLADLAVERQMKALQPPKLTAESFFDLEKQKQQLATIDSYSQRMNELHRLEEEQRQKTWPIYQEAKKKLDDEYLNSILNIRIKIDNADNLRLRPEDVAELEKELQRLQEERGERQRELEMKYEMKLKENLKKAADANGFTRMNEALAREKAEAEKARAQQRDDGELLPADKQLGQVMRSEALARKKAAVAAKNEEIANLENHILQDIASVAAKEAILYHLTMVFASSSVNIASYTYGDLKFSERKDVHPPVIGVKTRDLTEEIAAELKKLQK